MITGRVFRGGVCGAALIAGALSVGVGLAGTRTALAEEGGASPDMNRALAAGYKAAFTCSGLFNGGRSLDQIAANELDGLYPDYREILSDLPDAVVDADAGSVSVAWSETLPPRLAVWREGFGCTQMPIGAPSSLYKPETPKPLSAGNDRAMVLSPDVEAEPVTLPPEALETVMARAFDGAHYGAGTRTSAVVALRKGRIFAEQYDRGIDQETPQRTWSVAKSISATVIGAAVHTGDISVDEPAGLAAWQTEGDPRQAITVANLLHMASGLDSGRRGSRTDRLYFGGGRVADHGMTNPLEAAPGRRFKYANNDTLLAMRALRERMEDDETFHAFPYEALLWKIGARRTVLEVDWNGDVLSSSQVWTTARDLARIGQLYLQDGMWDGERLLPEGWAAYVARPAPAQPDSGDWGYGAQFWLANGQAGLPDDAFIAAGHRGQYILIVPSRDFVLVRRGFDPSGEARFDVASLGTDLLRLLAAADRGEDRQD